MQDEARAPLEAESLKVYTKEEIARIAPNYRGKPENFVKGFKAKTKAKGEAKSSSKSKAGEKTLEEFVKGIAPTNLNRGTPTPTVEQQL